MCIGIPGEYFVCGIEELEIPTANYILQLLFPTMSELSDEYRNDKKDAREKARFAVQKLDGCMDKKVDAIELGIYNHVPGDGRKYVLSDQSALKTNAEDGRPVEDIDLEPFFHRLSGNQDLKLFRTRHASGSVSQGANIVEAIGCGVKLLLIDEDKSATNFMIRDKVMRKIVPNEPIIPFTDRIEELNKNCGMSMILVIGGSAEYLAYADIVILMEDYEPK